MTAPRPAGARSAFLPYYRTGIAAALREPFRTGAQAQATMAVSLAVRALPADQDVAQPATADVNVTVRGPGDVVSLDPRQIIRRHPAPGTVNAEPGDLAHIEFDRPDLPWQFTPTGPRSDGNLPPWLRLVVVDAGAATFTERTADRLATLRVATSELPPPDDAWAWAHAQLLGTDVAAGLDENAPALNLSRLLCPRRLTEDKDWIACVVPVFQAGREAALMGAVQTTTLGYSWPSGDSVVDLPVYDSWRFRTGRDGDFATLAGRLWPADHPAPGVKVGIRDVDTGQPGNGISAAGSPDFDPARGVRGALVTADDPLTDGKQWPRTMVAQLRQQLELVAAHRYGTSVPGTPTVGPPLYGGAHIARGDVSDAAPGWFRALNLDPADRIVAGLGARVVQMDQEDLMASAWAQVGGVVATNQALRLAQFGRYLSESLHKRLEKLDPSSLLAVTNPVTGRIPDPRFGTVRARLAASVLPLAAIGQLRRFAAPRGPAVRFAGDAVTRTATVRRLLTDDSGRTRSWIYPLGDALGPTGPAVLADLSRELDIDPEDLAVLSTPDLRVAADGGAELLRHLAPVQDVTGRLLGAALDRLLMALPDADAEVDEVTDVGPRITETLRLAEQFGVTDLHVSGETVRELSLTPGTDDFGRRTLALTDLTAWWTDRSAARDTAAAVPMADRSANWQRAAEMLFAAAATPGTTVDTVRETVKVTNLDLVHALTPSITATRRVLGRLPRAADWPVWLPQNWFEDGRIEPVLTGPTFQHPMYEALHRYDPEWLMPGVADIQPAEMVTVLRSNRRFVEAFLTGCNTEFASELIWRGYPTDGRATSFRSFWTPADELTKPLHRFDPQAPLGGHLRDDVANALVVVVRGEIVRRYPTMLAALVTQRGQGDPPLGFNPTGAADPLFRLYLDPDILLLGFGLPGNPENPAERLKNPPPGTSKAWWFTLSEHVGEPRFGLIEGDGHPSSEPLDRDVLTWDDLDTHPNDYLVAEAPSGPVSGAVVPVDGAHLAWLLFRHPERAAFAARDILIANG